MPDSTLALFAFIFLLILPVNATRFICRDGSPLVCGDGSAPILQEIQDSFGRPDLNVRSLCPPSCNIYRNSCDPTTAPTCIYPDPRAKNPRAACACRPGYKASDTADGDTQKQWRLPVVGQEHRVWVAEGVRCDARCVGYGAQSCTEVALLGPDCVGDGAGAKPVAGGYGPGDSPPYSAGAGPGDGSVSEDAASTVIYVPPTGSSSYDTYGGSSSPYGSSSYDSSSYDTSGRSYDSSYGSNSYDSSYSSSYDSNSYDSGSYDGAGSMTETTGSYTYGKTQPTETYSYLPTASQDSSLSWDIPSYLNASGSFQASAGVAAATDMPMPFEVPDFKDQVQRRDGVSDAWQAAARKVGWRVYVEKWKELADVLTGVRNEFPMDERPNLCPGIRTWVTRACTRGIEIQNDNCGLANGADPRCLTFGLDTQCCATYEAQHPNDWCRGDQTWSNSAIEQRRKQMQDTCAVVTAGGRSAVKLYLSLGLLDSLLQVMKEGEEPIPLMAKVSETLSKWSRWKQGVAQLVSGNVQGGLNDLAELNPKFLDKGQNGVGWSEDLEWYISKDVDDFMLISTHVAYDVYVIMREREYIMSLLNGEQFGKRLSVIRERALRYAADVSRTLVPEAFGGFENAKDEASMDAAVAEYERFLGRSSLLDAARAWAVVVRVNRLTA